MMHCKKIWHTQFYAGKVLAESDKWFISQFHLAQCNFSWSMQAT